MNDQVIPAEAIEAAANIIVQGDRGACECRRSIFDKHDVNPPCSTRRQALRVACAALEAAAPYMQQVADDALRAAWDRGYAKAVDGMKDVPAAAWEQGRLVGRAEEQSGYDTEMNPYGDPYKPRPKPSGN